MIVKSLEDTIEQKEPALWLAIIQQGLEDLKIQLNKEDEKLTNLPLQERKQLLKTMSNKEGNKIRRRIKMYKQDRLDYDSAIGFFNEKNNWFKKVCFYTDVDYRDILVVAYTNM